MKTIRSSQRMQSIALSFKKKGKTIGFVPTMGFLHDGHLALVKKAKEKCDIVVVSIFVNPKQFGPKEDFSNYPRNLKSDLDKLKKLKVDFVFVPDAKSFYDKSFQTFVEVIELSKHLCGKNRPGHFRGVATVVMKLFQIVQPDKAFFGQKDYQQLEIIKRMVTDLMMPVKIHCLPTVREKDGLAMSSRNSYLSGAERKTAPKIYQALKEIRKQARSKSLSAKQARKIFDGYSSGTKNFKVDYFACVDKETLEAVSKLKKNRTYVAVAVKLGKTRLIDNIAI